MKHGRYSARDCQRRFPDGFYVGTDIGVELVIGVKFIRDICNDKRFSLWGLVNKKWFGNLSGFDVSSDEPTAVTIFRDTIRIKLKQHIEHTMVPISEEASAELQNVFSESEDWHSIEVYSSMLDIVSQESARVFLSNELRQDPNWRRITRNHVSDLFVASDFLRQWPRFLCPLVAWISPTCRRMRSDLQKARDLINPILEDRKARRATQLDTSLPASDDAIDWFEEGSQGRPYDPAELQLRLSIASLHTTTDCLTQLLCDLAKLPDVVSELRKEIVSVMKNQSWSTATLYNLKLLDSAIKESQRMKPMSFTTVSRMAEDTVKLPNGVVIRKGEIVNFTASNQMWDDDIYPNANRYDAFRFAKLREDTGQNMFQLVSSSSDHIGFGYGRNACPGRFFASASMKITLCHILLKYDFKFAEGTSSKVEWHGTALATNKDARLSVRRRQEEIVLP
ncbi:cytochrome P450 [Penicillium verhagenii]|uniref:cytochrome P450 n=1 Tax=Penicillium verhagenii TaxID=1562060 RepID=UPI0025452817|nr:cytochrome P450 [Penicillium verhagenii]KAJ5928249.1 cytochrome P450 [Penicillium verhagenii]